MLTIRNQPLIRRTDDSFSVMERFSIHEAEAKSGGKTQLHKLRLLLVLHLTRWALVAPVFRPVEQKQSNSELL